MNHIPQMTGSTSDQYLEPVTTTRPGLRRKKLVFITIFTCAGWAMIGANAFLLYSDLWSFVMGPSLAIAVLDVFWITIVARCPKCRKRVLTLTLWARGLMPIGVQKRCPFCKHPVNETYSISQ